MKKLLCALAASIALLPAVASAESNNPILPGFHADPEILYSQNTGKYYIYSTTDGNPGWSGTYYMCFSSSDLANWDDEGIVLDLATDQVAWAVGNCWAPAIEEKLIDGKYKYFLYFSGQPKSGGGKQIGVAVSDSPTGPFTDSGAPIVTSTPAGASGQQIDVDVFTDPVSGKSYLYWGNGYMAGAELNDDMLSIKKETIKVMTPKGGNLSTYAYREAPYVFFRNGKYYVTWSVDDTGSSNYHIAYGTLDSPLGSITVAANPVILIANPKLEIYGTGHNSVVQLPGDNDEWRIVYHRINSNYMGNDPGNHREVCIDVMRFNEDGTIIPVVPTTNYDESEIVQAPQQPIFLMQQGTAHHVEKGNATWNQALVRHTNDSEFGQPQMVSFVRNGLFYNIIYSLDGTDYYLQQDVSSGNRWTTMFLPQNADELQALWKLEDLGEGYYRIKNVLIGGYLGTGNGERQSGAWLYSDKSGSIDLDHFYFSTDASAASPNLDSIDALSADDDAAPEYFTITGIRLASPLPGLMIEKRGASVRKVIIK